MFNFLLFPVEKHKLKAGGILSLRVRIYSITIFCFGQNKLQQEGNKEKAFLYISSQVSKVKINQYRNIDTFPPLSPPSQGDLYLIFLFLLCW